MGKTKIIIDYVWVDGQEPQLLRSKTRILYVDLRRYSDINSYMGDIPRALVASDLEKIPMWEFDGTFTGQNPKCILRPIKLYKNTDGSYIVLSDTYDKVSGQPLSTNYRFRVNTIDNSKSKIDLAIKQEFFLMNGSRAKISDYYCGAESYGDNVVKEFVKTCMDLDIMINEINSSDYLGKWSYCLIGNNLLSLSDDLWISRFILHKICNKQKEKVIMDSSKLATLEIPLKLYVNYGDNELTFNSQHNPYRLFSDIS